LARIGGEEFSILLPETTLEAAKDVAERIRIGQSKMIIKGNWQGEINITVSIGISCLRPNDQSFEHLFSRTDKALYIAKDIGRNAVYILK
jgi:diguanylate cyclase (GGDEF)-like protein